MTCHLTAFPLTPEALARLAARDTALSCSRTILRSPAPHDKETIREACHAMMTWGAPEDWAEAYPVLRALDLPPVHVAPVAVTRNSGTGLIREGLRDSVILAAFGAAVLLVGLAL